jgi:hypothetical protein
VQNHHRRSYGKIVDYVGKKDENEC